VRIDLERTGYPREKAVQWWRQLGGGRDVPMSVTEALERVGDLTRPDAILIRANGRLSESVSYRFPDGRTFVETRRLGEAG
jgi:DNA repair protein RadD